MWGGSCKIFLHCMGPFKKSMPPAPIPFIHVYTCRFNSFTTRWLTHKTPQNYANDLQSTKQFITKNLSELLSYTSPVYKTRSSNDDLLLNIPFTRRSTFADRSFACMAPKLWNTLPYTIRSAINIENFKSNLKIFKDIYTYIFKKTFKV